MPRTIRRNGVVYYEYVVTVKRKGSKARTEYTYARSPAQAKRFVQHRLRGWTATSARRK